MTAKPKRKPKAGLSDETSTADLNLQLLTAAYNGRTEAVIAALDSGADVAAKHSDTGLTALHMAVGTNNLPLVKMLVEDWKAPFGPDGFGRWPTVVAIRCRVSEQLSDYIVEKEAQALGITE